jgi:methylenetetrahydrofolate reductase (NADPH)
VSQVNHVSSLGTLAHVVPAYPDGHTDKDANEDDEIEYLKAKVDAGADFIVTQLFYDVDGFLRWEKKVRQKG